MRGCTSGKDVVNRDGLSRPAAGDGERNRTYNVLLAARSPNTSISDAAAPGMAVDGLCRLRYIEGLNNTHL